MPDHRHYRHSSLSRHVILSTALPYTKKKKKCQCIIQKQQEFSGWGTDICTAHCCMSEFYRTSRQKTQKTANKSVPILV